MDDTAKRTIIDEAQPRRADRGGLRPRWRDAPPGRRSPHRGPRLRPRRRRRVDRRPPGGAPSHREGGARGERRRRRQDPRRARGRARRRRRHVPASRVVVDARRADEGGDGSARAEVEPWALGAVDRRRQRRTGSIAWSPCFARATTARPPPPPWGSARGRSTGGSATVGRTTRPPRSTRRSSTSSASSSRLVSQAEADAEAGCVAGVIELAYRKGDGALLLRFLERRYPDRWGRRSLEVTVSTADAAAEAEEHRRDLRDRLERAIANFDPTTKELH